MIAPESSMSLLNRAKAGDAAALDALVARYRPRLHRWAHRRLPAWARALSDTDDVIQDTFTKAIRNLDGFTLEGPDGFQHYLRRAAANLIRDHVRRARRQPVTVPLDASAPSDEPSPLERMMGRSRLDRYEAALARLTQQEQDAVVARLEFGFTHAELAAALGKNTPDAARKIVRNAIAHLLELMQVQAAE